ncbi:cupin domain-containing protein [Novosphingobium sp. G106]|uniref:cupin domain-containing protein n=1 Tax=Novosphingobium sp. G106 TaxID=2849500 RepID=UPI001C2D0890|nr:cupin domain-containing protein [Novosphingobium sp. G106]MBV1688679.1 cupin domain-containing protein [Novosphingobium sp. G106]
MRYAILLAGLLAGPFPLTPALADAPAPPAITSTDVPQDKGPQVVDVLEREFPVGGGTGWHVHSGVEIAYLVVGEMSFEQEGQPDRRQLPGQIFVIPRGVKHNATNVGTVPARLVVTLVVDKGQPLRTPVPAPAP